MSRDSVFYLGMPGKECSLGVQSDFIVNIFRMSLEWICQQVLVLWFSYPSQCKSQNKENDRLSLQVFIWVPQRMGSKLVPISSQPVLNTVPFHCRDQFHSKMWLWTLLERSGSTWILLRRLCTWMWCWKTIATSFLWVRKRLWNFQ